MPDLRLRRVSSRPTRGLARSVPQRVVLYSIANVVAIWSAFILVAALDRLYGSLELGADLVVLAVGGLVGLAPIALARAGRMRLAAGLALVTTWSIGCLMTWFTPVLTPVTPLMMHLPVLVLGDAFPLRTRTRILGGALVLTGLAVTVGEFRRPLWAPYVDGVPATPVLVGVTTIAVAAVLVIALREQVLRMARHGEELQRSRARLVDAALDARRAIERDLHDGAQQRLTSLAVELGRVTRLCESDPHRAHELVLGLRAQVDEAIRELRDLAHGIYPPLLEERGLEGALPAAARRTTLPCVVDARLAHRHVEAVEAAVYFCCLEAMQNADRHSGASRITVRVMDDGDDADGGLRFSVSDDGGGFAYHADVDSHGLTGMRDRIQSAGGELVVTTAPGQGTTVAGRFPPGTARADS